MNDTIDILNFIFIANDAWMWWLAIIFAYALWSGVKDSK